MTDPLAFVLKGYPRLSETFIAEEILGLEQAGLDIRIVALRRPTDAKRHPVHDAIRAPVAYLPEYLHQEPWRVLRALWALRRRPGLGAAVRQFRADLPRDLSRNRVRRLGQALVLAAELPGDVRRLHAHFIHTPASVTRYAGLILGLPWSCSAHAKDIWTSPGWELREKLSAALFTVTCTASGQQRLQGMAPAGTPVHLVYHGLRLDRFRPLVVPREPRDGTEPGAPVRLLAVGRAVAKKGFDVLIEALARLPPVWTLTHVGGGPLLDELTARVATLGLSGRIVFLGPQDQTAVLAQYRAADLFVLPCRVAADGDRDGLPNVLVEAQSQGLACVSTTAGGAAELIEPEVNGLLVQPDDIDGLAAALARLIADPACRERFGREGAARVARHFDARASFAALTALFAEPASPAAVRPLAGQAEAVPT